MLSRAAVRLAIPVALLCAAPSAVRAQSTAWASQCVNGAPAIPDGMGDAATRAALERLAWKAAYRDYTSVIAADGPLAAFDTLMGRAHALLRLTGDAGGRYAPDSAAILARLRAARTSVAAATHPPAFIVDSLPSFANLKPMTDVEVAGQVLLGGAALAFADSAPLPAVALCAASLTAYDLLDYLQAPALRQTAAEFARASSRWDRYVQDGYSMTLLERLGNSCRLGPLDWVVATTRAPHCRDTGLPALGPPSVRTVFLHPSGGIVPVLDSAGAFRSATVVEWYGILYHQYSDAGMRTFGVSVASEFPDRGRHRIGVLVHTPLGKVGYFESRGGVEGRRGRFTITADVLGWVPGVRNSARVIETSTLAGRLAALARGAGMP